MINKTLKKPKSVKKSKSEKKASDEINPIVNFLMRLSGEWPLSGPPPLTEEQYKKLFTSHPAFVDYFPIIDYDDEDQVYLLDDGINVAKIWRINPRYMCARSVDALDKFNVAVTQALNALPTDDSNPYVLQVFAQSQTTNSIATDLERAIANNGLSNDPLSQEILRINRDHAEMLSHERGVFPDSRITGGNAGWRLTEQHVFLCAFCKRPAKFWKKNKRTPSEQINHDLSAFQTALGNAGIDLKVLPPDQLINWLAPYFGHERVDAKELAEKRKSASFDIGQQIFHYQPTYHHTQEEKERGIWRFGDAWLRFLSIGGIESPPRDGVMTLGEQSIEGSNAKIAASLFEQLPLGSMMSYTIVPQSDFMMKSEIDQVLRLSETGASREAKYATEQAMEVHEEMMRNKHKVFYVQLGVFLKADSLHGLLDATESAIARIKSSGSVEVINPRFDLISQDSFIRNLPTVYDFAHDRKASLRARKCYTAHLASLLPFYGNKSGSENPCYIMYSRTGEPFYMNPFHRDDREKVSHEVFFGPSGSGKSATTVYMMLQSMAVNNPRMFVFDYGNSFGLTADYLERYGKKVKRITLNQSSEDVLAPFFETKKALEEAEKAQQISDGTWTSKRDREKAGIDTTGDEDEERSYLAEMEFILRIMVTGGDSNQSLTQSHISRISEALVRGLKKSVEAGEPHARPIHMAEAMRELADEEAANQSGLSEIALNLRNMADAINLWTKGLRGMLFNRTAEGFDPDYDFTVIEIGSLGKTGSEDMLAVAGLSAIYTITAMAEKLQSSGRGIQVKIDEAHLWAKISLLMQGLIVASKVFRKLNCWLSVITQDVSDFAGESSKILTNSEFWWLMKMSEKEIKQITTILDLDDEVKHLLRFPRKEDRCFVEGVSITAKYPETLVRYIPPSLILALGQTDGKEKEARQIIMQEQNISELDAALQIAEEIDSARRSWQKQGY